MSAFDSPVREYASRTLISVAPEASLADVQELFEARDVSAVPVIDARGELRGIFSTTDLLRVSRIEMESPRSLARAWPPPREVGHVMRTAVVTIDEEAPLHEAAAKMIAHRIHRVVVTRKGSPVSVLSTRDAMRALLNARVTEPLSRVMTAEVESIDVGESIEVAVARLTDANVHGLVVVDGSWPVGVFTQREAIQARALPVALRSETVEHAMSYETICHDAKTPLFRVVGQMIDMNVRRVLAVDARKLVGVATGFDLVRFMTLTDAPS